MSDIEEERIKERKKKSDMERCKQMRIRESEYFIWGFSF